AELLIPRSLFRQAHILGRQLEAIARGILAPVGQGQQLADLASGIAVAPQQRAAAFVREGLRAVGFDAADEFFRDFQGGAAHSSLQKRSVRYLSPESGKIVTITARSPDGSRRATSSEAHRAAPELTPARMPSSRARRRTTACASSVRTSIFSSASVESYIGGTMAVAICLRPSSP